MKISLKTMMPLAAAGALSLVSCDSANKRVESYMLENNHSLENFLEVSNSKNLQSKLDSVAYRDIFNSTQAAKDSAKVAEFNKIASKMRGAGETWDWNRFTDINDKLAKEGVSYKDFKRIEDTDQWVKSDVYRINTRQHYADDWAYRMFFSKIGIMNDSIAQKCDEISKKVRPY